MMTTAALAPRFAQHEHKVILRFDRQEKSPNTCEMRVYDQATNKEIFHTQSWDTLYKRQIWITCKELNGQEALLYILKQKTRMYKERVYHIVGEDGIKEDPKAAFFSARSLGYHGKGKNDFIIEYKRSDTPMSKIWIRKCYTKVSFFPH